MDMNSLQLIRKGLSNPTRIPGYVLGKIFPDSRFGGNVKYKQGNITFELGGFANAKSRPLLLARHNHELLYIQRYLNGKEFDKSLEIGCGYGRLSPIFSQFSNSSFAIDINEDAVRIAQTHYPEINFDVQNATDIGYSDDNFDIVTTWTALQHIPPEQIDDAISEITRVLSDDGTLLMCEATRYPDQSGGHTWDRAVEEYEDKFSPLKLQKHSYIGEIDDLPDMETPGRVMLFEK